MAAGFSAQPGHLLVKTQAVQGTIAPDLATDGIGIKLRSGSLGSDRELMIPDPEIGGGRDITDSYLGPVKWSGSYDFYGRIDSFLTLLAACLGDKGTPVTTTGITTHTIKGSDGAALPFLSIEELIGAGLECYDYTDAVVNTFHLEAAADGYLMGTAGMIAAKQVAGVTPTDLDTATLWDNLPMVVGANITVTYNGIALPAKSFSLDINNNFQDDDFRLGSLYLGSLVPKRREVTANVTIQQEDIGLWRQAVYGASSATAPQGIPTKQPLVINVATYENIVGGTPTTPQQVAFTIPKSILKPYALGPSGDDVITPSVDIQAIRPDPAVAILTAVGKTARDVLP